MAASFAIPIDSLPLESAPPPARELRFREARLPGCFVVEFPKFSDHRGSLVKAIQRSAFAAHGLRSDFAEVFYTTSEKDVLRGMHFQAPPSDHAKLVYCLAGSISDVALDLRAGSPTFSEHEVYELTSEANNAIYLPSGIAHGFYVQEAPSVVVYHVTTEHDPARDAGVHWNSFGAAWPGEKPIVSARDAGFPTLAEYETPFRYVSPRGETADDGRQG